jgi:RHS repeat-associated protein
VTLRFNDAPFAHRGGAAWGYTVTFTLQSGTSAAVQSALTINRGLDKEAFEAVAVFSPLPGTDATLSITGASSPDESSLPDNITLDFDLTGGRSFDFDPTKAPSIVFHSGVNTVELQGAPLGTAAYEFEWTYVDDYDPPPPAFYAREPVRARSPTHFFNLDLAFPSGKVLVRGRALGRFPGEASDIAPDRGGKWSAPITISISNSCGVNSSCVAPVESKMNWSYTGSYAESSEAVSRLSLFDGSLRNRQSQHRLRTQGERLISETEYDSEGRGRIKMLPTPVAGEVYAYAPAFSAFDPTPNPQAPYDQKAFDSLTPPPPVSNTSAVGKYYSNAVGAASPDAYIPDAGGHPFAAVEPVRDSTSRPRRVGGYGAALALGTGHETLFRYGTAASTVLHKLFGRNVGRAPYYERSLQIDPNGQAHVAYVDRSGKTIATGLAGDSPSNLKSIAPNGPISWATYSLDANNSVDAASGTSRSVNSIAVTATQNFFFDYELKGVEYSVPGDPDAHFPPVCETCQYSLSIKITDQNGLAVALCQQATPGDLSHADCSCSCPDPSDSSNPLCKINKTEINTTFPTSSVAPNICRPGDPITDQIQPLITTPGSPVQFCAKLSDGEYEVVKELKALDGGLNATLANDITAADFVAANASVPATTDPDRICGQDCNSFCKEASKDPAGASNSYKSCLKSCQNPQIWSFGVSATRSCDSLQSELDRDFEPNGILAGHPKPHPEQCQVGVCRKRNDPDGNQNPAKSSDAFDDRMMAVDSYDDALACGYFDPLVGTPGVPAISGVCPMNVAYLFSPNSRDHDPVFDPGSYAESAKPSMIAIMGDFTDNMSGFSNPAPPAGPSFLHKSAWDTANDSSLYTDAAHPQGGATPSKDQVWHMFRVLYLEAKHATLSTFTATVTAPLPAAPTQAGGNCPYWTDLPSAQIDPHAHFKPFTFSSIQDVAAEAISLERSYGQAFCPIRVAQWTDQLEQNCPALVSSASKASISADLLEFCKTSANSGDFFSALTKDAIANDPSLKAAELQLVGISNQCSLAKIAVAPPFSTKKHLCPPTDLFSDAHNPYRYFGQCHDVFSGVNPTYKGPEAPTTDQRLAVCRAATADLKAQQSQIALSGAALKFETSERRDYFHRCLDPKMQESFSYQFAPNEYHYTLHYYDQADDLVETVPAAGVHPLGDKDAASLDADPSKELLPDHGLISRYQYNSIGQPIREETPDAGWKRFWYDDAGQLRLSQSAQQEADSSYAYVKYDPRGRIVETGLVAGLPDVPNLVTAAAAANQPITNDQAKTTLDQWLRCYATNLADFPAAGNLPPAGTNPLLQSCLADIASFPAAVISSPLATEQVVTTTYDQPANACQPLNAQNLRGRISAIVAQSPLAIGDVVTCYSYDPHGNISSLVQRLPGLGDKRIDYDYDILDGKILATHYQSGFGDALHHRHTYDLDRRLSTVETSRDGVFWERDATYSYYRHGPLARLELGADRVQGLDYLYAITGWPKGVNSDSLDASRDPGGDGRAGGANALVAQDVFGSAVHYFPGDYAPVGAAAPLSIPAPQFAFASATGLSALASASCPQAPNKCGSFDGNVAATVQSVAAFSPRTLGTAYRYDQLYRLIASTPFTDPTIASNAWPATSSDPNLWRTELGYDENGNITWLNRHAPDPTGAKAAGLWMDQLTYQYPFDTNKNLTSNRLLHINDSVSPSPYNNHASSSPYPEDIDLEDQGTFDPANPDTANYAYDLSGRLTRDWAAGINKIVWNAASQISRIERQHTAAQKYNDLEFVYDGLGNRIAKIAVVDSDPAKWRYEYFVRNEKGEILAIYKKSPPATGAGAPIIALEDQTIVGAGRLGVWKPADPPWAIVTLGGAGSGNSAQTVSTAGTPVPTIERFAQVRGAKQYELANYLGHVYSTITDRKREIPFGLSASTPNPPPVTHYEAEVVSASDYDPFGSLLYGRNQANAGGVAYRYGFSGLERDDEIKGAGNSYYTNARLFDPRLGRWLSPDPVHVADSSPFVGFGNNPQRYSDPKGTNAVPKGLEATIREQLSTKNWITQKAAVDHALVEESKRRVAQQEGPQMNAADPLWLQAAHASRQLPLVNPNNQLESLIQVPVVIATAEVLVGGGLVASALMSGLNLGSAFNSRDPVDITIAGIGVLSDAYMMAHGGIPKTPEEPWLEKPWDPCPGGSFGPSTPVQTDHGLVPIRDVKIGDLVLSGDEATGTTTWKQVEDVVGRLHESSVHVFIRAENGGSQEINTTPEHPFWVEGRGWTPADKIRSDTRVRSMNGWKTVDHAERVSGENQAFNLTVNGLHTFFVGKDRIWVHNATPCAEDLPKEGIYEFPDQKAGSIPYVGQSGDLPSRLGQHEAAGRLKPGTEVTTEVSGGKTAREVAEHKRIQELTGGQKAKNSPSVSNKRDPVGSQRRSGLGIPEPHD